MSDDGFYNGIEDGAGCAEIWEKLSERRKKDRDEKSEQESQD
jgi:hypothetical protein